MGLTVSHSKARTFRRCQKQYDFKYIHKLEPKKKGVALEKGSWLHELLMTYYDGEDWRVAHAVKTQEFNNLFDEEKEDLGDLPGECERIMLSYLHRWKAEDRKHVVIDSEMDEIVTLPNGVELNIIVDLITEEKGVGLWAWDHKSRKKFADRDLMILDPQLTLYYWGLHKMGYPILGVIVNEIRTKPPAIPPVLKSGRLTERASLDTDALTYYRTIRKCGQDPQRYARTLQRLSKQKGRFFRRTHLPKDRPLVRIQKEELMETAAEIQRAHKRGVFPRTFLTSCNWDCSYTELCLTQLMGGDISSMVKANYQRRTRAE